MSLAIALALGVWALTVAGVYGVAVVRAVWAGRRPVRSGSALPPVLLVRPCAGTEPSLSRSLALSPDGLPPGSRVRFAVAREDDPATPFCDRAAAELRAGGVDATRVVTAAAGPNQKASQLAAVLAREPDDLALVAVVDSDVDPASLVWSELVGNWVDDPGVSAVWSPTVESAGTTLGDRASSALLGVTLHAFPLLAGLDPAGLVGKVMVVRRGELEAVGGFAALTGYLGEDMELSRRLRARGGRVVATGAVARSLATGRSWEAAVGRYGRWLVVIRGQRPGLLASYPLLFFATPLVLAGAAGVCTWAGDARARAVALGAAGVVLGARAAAALAGRWRRGSGPWGAGLVVDAVLGDALLGRAFLRALGGRTVWWRGRALRVGTDGALTEGAGAEPDVR